MRRGETGEKQMVDEKIIDGATFVLGAFIGAVVFFAPQINALFADNPTNALIVGIIMMTITNIGSRFAIKQVKTEQEAIAEPPTEPPVDEQGGA